MGGVNIMDEKRHVILPATDIDGMSVVSNEMRQTKGSATKTPVSCPNIIKLYNNGMGGVNIMDKKQFVCLLATNVDGMSGVSNVMRQNKGFSNQNTCFLS